MNMENSDHQKQYLERARNELTEHLVYHKLSLAEENPSNRALLEKLSAQEKTHYEFWKGLLPADTAIEPHWLGLHGTPFLCAVLGVTFTTKFLETHERGSVTTYTDMLAGLAPAQQSRLKEIIEDEKSHENALLGQLTERRVAYIGFVALGLADAIVEITGVHAGFLGVTGSTLVAGISGIIVGFAAAISMGSAAYIQAKQDPDKSPIISAVITGVSYMSAVICLALPYFFIRTMITAFTISTLIGLTLLASFTFYGAVAFDRKFSREFGESAILMLATALATYILGRGVSGIFHVGLNNF